MRSCLVVLALALACVVSHAASLPLLPPVAVCPTVDEAPKLDGDLSDPVWERACAMMPFVLTGTGQPATMQTTVRICRDDTALYLAFECAENTMGQLKTDAKVPDRGEVWADDDVEVFIAPRDPVRYGYYHVAVNAAGTVDDERYTPKGGRDMAWNSLAIIAVAKQARGWACEMAIPYASLGATPADGEAWRINVNRAEQAHHEWSSWASLDSSFHEPARFGGLVFAPEPVVTAVQLSVPFIGKNTFSVSVAGEPEGYRAAIHVVRGTTGARKVAVPIKDGKAAGEYLLTDEGEGYVRLALQLTKTDRIVYATPALPFSIPPVESRLQKMLARIDTLRDQIAGMPNETAKTAIQGDFTRLDAALAALRAELSNVKRQGTATRAQWDQAMARLQDLGGPLAALAIKGEAFAALKPGEGLPGYGLAVETSLRKIRRDDRDLEPGRSIHLYAAQRERESAQVVIIPFSNLRRVQVSWSDLTGPKGAVLPRDNVRVWQVGYVKTRRPSYPVGYVGWYPDPLLPLRPFDALQGQVQPLWVTVYAPPEAVPGDYKGTITIRPAGQPASRVALTLTVWNFALPLQGRLKTAFSTLYHHDIPRWYGFPNDTPTPEFLRRYYDLMLEHRLNPTSLYESDTWPRREDLDYCLERGLNSFNLRNIGDPSDADIASLKEWADYLRGKGLLNMAYVYGYDEVQPDRYDELNRAWTKLHQAIPDLKRCCTVVPNDKLKDAVDIFVPLTAAYDISRAESFRKQGKEVWWYICCGPQHPYQNWFIDYPATDARTLFWSTWKYRVTGFLYYEVAMWRTNWIFGPTGDDSQQPPDDPDVIAAIKSGKRWPDVPWNTYTFARFNGDGLLVYPGKDGVPLPSLRLEVIRDGIEDYEMLGVLATYVARLEDWDVNHEYGFLVAEAKQVLAVNPAVVRDLTHYTSDPQVILGERQKVAQEILRIKRVMGE